MSLETDLQEAIRQHAASRELWQQQSTLHEQKRIELQSTVNDTLLSLNSKKTVSPNILPDTQNFNSFCNGQKKVIFNLSDANSVKSPWHAFFAGASTDFHAGVSFEIVPIADANRLTTLGLNSDYLGYMQSKKMIALNANNETWGVDYACLIVDVQVTAGTATLFVGVNDRNSLGHYVGNGFTYNSIFAACLQSNSSHIMAVFAENFGFNLTEQKLNHYIAKGIGKGGPTRLFWLTLNGVGHSRYLFTLPYSGSGDHGELPIWAGFTAAQNGVSYLRGD